MRWRLGMDQCNDGKQCNACDHTDRPFTMTSKALHVLLCAQYDSYRKKHDNIRNLIYKLAHKARWNPRREVKYLFGNGLKPADVWIPLYNEGKSLCLDITIPNVMAPSRYVKQLKDKDYTFNNALSTKNKKYLKKCSEHDLLFKPFIIDVYGRFETNTFNFIKELCEPIAENTGYSKEQTMDYLFRSISMTLMKDIAKDFRIRTKE